MRVKVDVEDVELEGDNGEDVPGVKAICRRCDQEAEAFGQSVRSVRRACMKLREDCPMGEENFYAIDDDDLDGREE